MLWLKTITINQSNLYQLNGSKGNGKNIVQQNIQICFQAIGLLPINPSSMDERTKLSEVYTTTLTNMLYKNSESPNDALVDSEHWGENGIATNY
jgi:hypothetical protein